MSNLDRVGLEDLQELAESFANLNMVDLKMNEDGGIKNKQEETSRQGEARAEAEISRRDRRKRRPNLRDTPVGKVTLEPIHPYGLVLNLDEARFKDWESLIDE